MSLKPVKKSDQNKSWMQPRRDRRKMIQPEYHLIVTEGTETEPPYFNAMRTIINANYPDKINVKVEGKGDIHRSEYWPKLTEILKSPERENTAKTATICTEFCIHTWMTLSSTPRSLKKSTKEKHHPNQPPVL